MNGVRKDEDVAALGVHRVADACSVSRSWRSDAWAAATHLSPPELPCRLVVAFALPCLALPPSRWNAASILVSLRKSTLDEGLLGSWSRRSEVPVGDGPDGRVCSERASSSLRMMISRKANSRIPPHPSRQLMTIMQTDNATARDLIVPLVKVKNAHVSLYSAYNW